MDYGRESEMLHLKDLGPPQRTYGTISGTNYFPSPTRNFVIHEVRGTETLAGLSLKYDLTVEDLRRTNSLWANDNVYPGQVLKIPVKNQSEGPVSGSWESPRSSGSGSDSASSRDSRDSLNSPARPSSSSRKSSVQRQDETVQEYLSKLDKSIESSKKGIKKLVKNDPPTAAHSFGPDVGINTTSPKRKSKNNGSVMC